MSSISDFKLINNPNISDYVYLLDLTTNIQYPIKRIAKPSSRFSNAKWLKSTSKLSKDLDPIFQIENGSGDLLYYAWENTLQIPSDLRYSRRLG